MSANGGRAEREGAESERAEDDRRQAPFADRNLAALKIGNRSPRVYGKVAEGIAADLVEAVPWIAEYPEELAALAQTEAVVALIRVHVAGRGILNPDGSVRESLLDRYIRAESAAAKRRDALGLSPLGQATLAERRASAAVLASQVDLAALAARGRAALEARREHPDADLVVAVLDGEQETYRAERETTTAKWQATRTDEGDPDDNDD